jgi:putative oxidoreductase
VAALLYVCHGAQKLFGFPGGRPVVGTPWLQMAGVIELVARGLIAVGLFTS